MTEPKTERKAVGTDIYVELYLLNKNLDSLIRVLQRIELLGICPNQLLKLHEARLEELRTSLNSELLAATLTQEQTNKARFKGLVAAMCENPIEKNRLH
jgi:hypothetical protein